MTKKEEEYIRSYQDKTREYFIENFLKVFDANLNTKVPFKLFPRQKAFLKSLSENNNTIAIKHRQAGITTLSCAWIAAQILFARKDSPETILVLGNQREISQQILEKIIDFLDQIPRWMWGSDFYSPDEDSEKNKKSIYINRNKQKIKLFNGCEVFSRSSKKDAARGISAVSILIFDEAAFIQDGPDVYAQAVAATASVKNAKIIMVSTPNGKDQLYYKTYSNALKKENNYNPVEFKWYQDLRYNKNLKWFKKNEETGDVIWDVDKVINEDGSIVYDEDRWRTLEKEGWTPTSPWYREMCYTLDNDEIRINKELNVSFVGSSDNVVSPEVIEFHRQNNMIKIEDGGGYFDNFVKETWIWEPPVDGHRYILSVDPSSGSSEDFTAIEVLDIDAIDENGTPYVNQVLEYYGKMAGDEIGNLIYKYGKAYNNAFVVVEAIGGYGDAPLLKLRELKYDNLYYDEPSLKDYTKDDVYMRFNTRMGDKLPGFRTSSLRTQMVSNFVSKLKENTFRIRSMRVITELETWVFKNGRADHMDGMHDDSLTCLAMGLFVMEYYMLKNEQRKMLNKAIISSWIRPVSDKFSTSAQNQANNGSIYDMDWSKEGIISRAQDMLKNKNDKRQKMHIYSSGFFNRNDDAMNDLLLCLGSIKKNR